VSYTNLISASELFPHLHQPGWVILDCRFDLTNFEAGFQQYQNGHIPGSGYAHLNRDLSSEVTPQSGRHPLPDPQRFVETLASWGITPETQVIAYDSSGGSFAVRLWWLLRLYGHMSVAVLNGGFPAWPAGEFPVASGTETLTPVTFRYPPSPRMEEVASLSEVERIRTDPQYKLIDARSPERFRGENETIDTAAGHIPGAINRFYGLNLDANGLFKDKDQLRVEFESLIGSTTPDHIVYYCGSGVTSCHHLLAMDILGITGSRLYVGSWSEWIRDPKRPRE
jgi:thiosulfate/3-mercaptopyruvate sulfurtransferase